MFCPPDLNKWRATTKTKASDKRVVFLFLLFVSLFYRENKDRYCLGEAMQPFKTTEHVVCVCMHIQV